MKNRCLAPTRKYVNENPRERARAAASVNRVFRGLRQGRRGPGGKNSAKTQVKDPEPVEAAPYLVGLGFHGHHGVEGNHENHHGHSGQDGGAQSLRKEGREQRPSTLGFPAEPPRPDSSDPATRIQDRGVTFAPCRAVRNSQAYS